MRNQSALTSFARTSVFACLGLALAGTLAAQGIQPPRGERQVKAAFVYNFAKFVEWPAHRSAHGPLTVGIVGDPALAQAVADATRGKMVRGREIEVRYFPAPETLRACDILYVALSNRENTQLSIHAVKDLPTLTIGELEGFSDWGGMIEMFLEDHKFRFAINAGAAHRSGLKVSSRLLQLARTVKGNRSP